MSEAISELIDLLRRMETVNPDIQGSGIVSTQGLPIYFTRSDVNNEIVSAICATILSISEHAVEELACGNLKRILIEGVNGIITLSKAGENAILSILAKRNASLGDIFRDYNNKRRLPRVKDAAYAE